jgi:hypothetical protein
VAFTIMIVITAPSPPRPLITFKLALERMPFEELTRGGTWPVPARHQ